MIIYENHCVCCQLPCINCGKKHTPVRVCDNCGDYIDESIPYKFEDMDLCEKCYAKEWLQEYLDIDNILED